MAKVFAVSMYDLAACYRWRCFLPLMGKAQITEISVTGPALSWAAR